MIDTLVKMSGTTHESRVDQKTITRDNERVLNKNEGKISYTMATKEVPVIGFNDFMFIKERNSIVLKAGGSPLWNREESAYPMSFRLFKDTIKIPGKDFTLQTIPTNSTAKDFDVRKNQPDFFNMLTQRIDQAKMSTEMRQAYLSAYNLTETELLRLDQNVVADDIMHAINARMFGVTHKPSGLDDDFEAEGTPEDFEQMPEYDDMGNLIERTDVLAGATENTEVLQEAAKAGALLQDRQQKRFAGKTISRDDLVSQSGAVNRQLDKVLALAYEDCKGFFDSGDYRVTDSGELVHADGERFVRNSKGADKEDVERLQAAESESDTRVFGETDAVETFYEVTDAFIKHLAEMDSWSDLAEGRFEIAARKAYERLKM